jgi:hypothetical protein
MDKYIVVYSYKVLLHNKENNVQHTMYMNVKT